MTTFKCILTCISAGAACFLITFGWLVYNSSRSSTSNNETVYAALPVTAEEKPNIKDDHNVYAKPASTTETFNSDKKCFGCITNFCLSQSLNCAKVDGCADIVSCLRDCSGNNPSDCARKCADSASEESEISARNALLCQIAQCPKECFSPSKTNH